MMRFVGSALQRWVVPWLLEKLHAPAAESCICQRQLFQRQFPAAAVGFDLDVGSNLQVTADTRTQKKFRCVRLNLTQQMTWASLVLGPVDGAVTRGTLRHLVQGHRVTVP
jgi:hypothetical protein